MQDFTPARLERKDREHILDLIYDSFMARNMDGRIAFWNRGAGQMYGWTKDEVIGKVSHTLLQTRFPRALEEIEVQLERNGVWEGNLLHARKDGQTVSVKSRWVLRKASSDESARVLEINSIRN
jgi:PAS domain S-box-containing protein